jgi:tyrosinase
MKVCVTPYSGLNERYANMMMGGTNWMNPNSAKGKPTDEQELNVVAPAGMNHLRSSEFFSTTAGPLCYVYA